MHFMGQRKVTSLAPGLFPLPHFKVLLQATMEVLKILKKGQNESIVMEKVSQLIVVIGSSPDNISAHQRI